MFCVQSNDRRIQYAYGKQNDAIRAGDGYDDKISDRNFALKSRDGRLQRISALHSAYTSLHYVIIFHRRSTGIVANYIF